MIPDDKITFVCTTLVYVMMVMTSCQGIVDRPIEIGNNYFYDDFLFYSYDGTGTGGLDVIIPNEIADINYDSRYIVVKHVPSKESYEFFAESEDSIGRDSVMALFQHCQELGTSYWVIDMANHNRYGPCSKEAFLRKCDSLSVRIKLD